MTVASETNRSGPYTGNGVTTAFNYGFRILAASHIQVVLTENDVDTVVNAANYTVSGVGDAAGGSVTFATAPTSTQTVTIIRNLPFTQTTDLENQGAYYAETIEEALDLATMRDQELQEQIDRSLKIPVGQDSSTLDDLIADVVRLNDSVANVDTVAGAITNVNTVATNIANVNTVGGIAADVTAVAAIDADVTVAADNIAAIVDAPNQATAAAASASAAATSETNAAGSATAAAGSATNAATSETNAAGSASAAATSETNAAGSATAAAGSASAASTSETNAAASANAAATSETNAATSSSNAATSETNAATSATNSANSATLSADWAEKGDGLDVNGVGTRSARHHANAAASSASAASTSATNAATSETNAANSAAAAAASFDDFDDRYLGAKTGDPTLDNDGAALITGALYFNTTANQMRVYNGTAWAVIAVNTLGDLSDVNTTGAAAGDGLSFNGTAWVPGAAGGGMFKGENGTVGSRAGDIFRINEQTLNTNVTIDAAENASCAGPLAIASGVTLTVSAGGNLSIV